MDRQRAAPRLTRREIGIAGLGLAVLLAGCGKQATADAGMANMPGMAGGAADAVATPAPPAATPVAATAVTIQNFAFAPAVITVPVGTAVTWTNQDIEQHTVTARDKTFDSGVLANGKSFRFTFSKAGTYDYNCIIHPEMVGRVVVSGQ